MQFSSFVSTTMPASPAGGAFGGGPRPLGGGWPPRTNSSWSSDVGGADGSVGPAPTNGEKTRDLRGGAAVGLGETPPPVSSSSGAAASGEGSDSVRFFAIGDWGNPSRRLKKVARVMSVRPFVWYSSLARFLFHAVHTTRCARQE